MRCNAARSLVAQIPPRPCRPSLAGPSPLPHVAQLLPPPRHLNHPPCALSPGFNPYTYAPHWPSLQPYPFSHISATQLLVQHSSNLHPLHFCVEFSSILIEMATSSMLSRSCVPTVAGLPSLGAPRTSSSSSSPFLATRGARISQRERRSLFVSAKHNETPLVSLSQKSHGSR